MRRKEHFFLQVLYTSPPCIHSDLQVADAARSVGSGVSAVAFYTEILLMSRELAEAGAQRVLILLTQAARCLLIQ